jgi:hypothetical protein
MIERLVDLLSQQQPAMQDVKILYSQLKTFMPLWRPLVLDSQETPQKFKVVDELLSDPRVEIFNSCFREFEQESYEDTFNGSIQKIKSILDKLYIQKLAGNDNALTVEQLAFTNQGLDKIFTHDHAADHRFKRRLVRIVDIIEQKFKEAKLNRNTDELVALQKMLCTWGEHGHTMCPAGRDKVLDQFYQDYLKNNPGKSSAALSKADWSLEMQVAVWLAEFRYQLVNKLVVETDDDRMHAVGHLERKVRILLSLLGNAEKRRDGLEQTAVPAKYLAMSPTMIMDQVKQDYTPENLISYLVKRINEQPYNKEEYRKAPLWDKLFRRLQFQFIREEIAPHGRMDYSFLRDEDYILDKCTEDEFKKTIQQSITYLKSEEGSSSNQTQDWQVIKDDTRMKALTIIEDHFYDFDGHFTPKGAQILLHSLGYLEHDSFPMQ